MKKKNKETTHEGIADTVLSKVDKIIPGFHGFFKKAEKSKIFGMRLGEIKKEIERRFGASQK